LRNKARCQSNTNYNAIVHDAGVFATPMIERLCQWPNGAFTSCGKPIDLEQQKEGRLLLNPIDLEQQKEGRLLLNPIDLEQQKEGRLLLIAYFRARLYKVGIKTCHPGRKSTLDVGEGK
jgi:hypothetical protein